MAWSYDEEHKCWSAQKFASQEEARAEVALILDDDPDLEQLFEDQAPAPDMVEMASSQRLTPAGLERVGGRCDDAYDMVILFWAEDVLRGQMNLDITGVWWNDLFDPDELSAPRGAILPSALAGWTPVLEKICDIDDQDQVLSLPAPLLVKPAVLSSRHVFVTDCVSADGDDITDMVDHATDISMGYETFCRALGNGKVAAGRRLLDAVFPSYREGRLDMAKDYHVTYHQSVYQGLPCLYVVHSATEYVFQRQGLLNAVPVSVTGPDDDRVPDMDAPGTRHDHRQDLQP